MKTRIFNLTRLCLAWILLALVPAQLFAQIKVTRLESQVPAGAKTGIVYTLPRTVIIADLSVSKSHQLPGPLASYAAEIMGIDNVITKDAVSFALEQASLRTVTEPDPEAVFLIEKEEKSQGEVWISMHKPHPLMVIEVFDKDLGPEGFSEWNKELFQSADALNLFQKFTDSPTREITDTIVRKVSIDTLVIEETIFRHTREEFSDLEKAQEAAARIRQIEHDKYNLLIGYPETAYSREALEFMLDKLEQQRQDYMRLFTGVTVKETLNFSIPVSVSAQSLEYEVAGFNKSTGLTDADGQNAISLILEPLAGEGNPLVTGGTPSGPGLVYQVPAKYRAVLTFQEKELHRGVFDIYQLGARISLPPAFKRIEFNLETGALENVVME